jgi:hypothetical protein
MLQLNDFTAKTRGNKALGFACFIVVLCVFGIFPVAQRLGCAYPEFVFSSLPLFCFFASLAHE